VEEQDRIAFAGLGEVDPQPAGVDEAMADALDCGQAIPTGRVCVSLTRGNLSGRGANPGPQAH